jgi:hypothetical protein
MGAGLTLTVVTTTLVSLNEMFNSTNIGALKTKYRDLKQHVYPNLMKYTPPPPASDRHDWRQSTLRHAGWLLTSEVHLGYKYPGSNLEAFPGHDFIKWLKWLTWVQTLGAADADVKITPAPPPGTPAITPAQAILDTLTLALNDTTDNGVHFDWSEMAKGGTMKVTVDQRPTSYTITVVSVRSDDIPVPVSDNDEDKQLPS